MFGWLWGPQHSGFGRKRYKKTELITHKVKIITSGLLAWSQNCARHTDSSVKTWVAELPWRSSVLRTHLPMQETRVWSLDREDPLEEGMATHSSLLACRIPRTEGPGGLQSMGSQRVRYDWAAEQHSCFTMPAVCILPKISCGHPSKKGAPFTMSSIRSPFIWL